MKFRYFIVAFSLCLINNYCTAQNFETLGTGLRVSGSVTCIEMDTIHNRMFVAGEFTQIDNVQSTNLAWRDSLGWHSFGTKMNGTAHSLKYLNGRLYVAGSFTTIDGQEGQKNICYWDSTGWHSMDGGANASVFSMEYFNSKLYISGYFTFVGNLAVNHVAYWDGNSWGSVGTGPDNQLTYFTKLDTVLYAYGRFKMFNGIASHGICQYDGVQWAQLALQDTNLYTQALALCGGQLFASVFNTISGQTDILKYNGTSWNNLLINVAQGNNNPFISYRDTLYLFTKINGITFDSLLIKKFNQTGQLSSDSLYSIQTNSGHYLYWHFAKSFNDVLYVGGTFRNFNGQVASGVVCLNNNSVEVPFHTSSAQSVTYTNGIGYGMLNDTTLNRLIVYGRFDFAGDSIAHSVASWDGTNWSPLGSGFSCAEENTFVQKMVIYNGQYYACGTFKKSGNKTVNNIAVWNGSDWDSVGTGANKSIYEMIVYDNILYVLGKFTTFNGLSNVDGFVKFDGNVWSAVPALINNATTVYASCIHNNKLLVTGNFNFSGVASRFAQFDGTTWSAFPGPGTGVYEPIISINGTLYAGATNHVYKYNGSNWSSAFSSPSGAPAFQISSFTDMVIIGSTLHNKTHMLNAQGQLYDLCYHIIYNSIPIDSNSAYVSGYIPSVFPQTQLVNHIGILRRQQPNVQFTYNSDTICPHEYVSFEATNTDILKLYDWTFPGGIANVSSSFSPSIKYNLPGDYDVKLKVTNAFGSDSVFFPNLIHVGNCVVGLEDYAETKLLTFPNPVSDYLTVQFSTAEKINFVTVYNVLGEKEMEYSPSDQLQSQELHLNLSNLKQGVYILRIDAENFQSVTKIIKN
ncbi:MAG TPA: T9SS type A sorting domain-containing protein [Bacteroidia bacterium]|nr:T9SS type A sorting domain-containing protein [Bacteroidia bacterium]